MANGYFFVPFRSTALLEPGIRVLGREQRRPLLKFIAQLCEIHFCANYSYVLGEIIELVKKNTYFCVQTSLSPLIWG